MTIEQTLALYNESETLPYWLQLMCAIEAVNRCGAAMRHTDIEQDIVKAERGKHAKQQTAQYQADLAQSPAPQLNKNRFEKCLELVDAALDSRGHYGGRTSPNAIALAFNEAGHNDIMPAHIVRVWERRRAA